VNAEPAPARGKHPDHPFRVAEIASKLEDWINKLGEVWVEGQIVDLTRRGTMRVAFATLRDPEVNSSLALTIPVTLLDSLATPLEVGSRVIVHAKTTFWTTRGSLQLSVRAIKAVGLGALLAQIEALRAKLAAQGLFDPERKKPLPFIPRVVGLVTGRDSDAKKDVVTNAQRRWPGVVFEIREVAVQGTRSAAEVTAALKELDALDEVDVIVIARGGGGVEDLLPFSSEDLLLAVAEAKTPVVSAIGHEADCPLLDLVADVRASTPTDAGKRVVPDLETEMNVLVNARVRLTGAVKRRLAREQDRLDHLRTRPALARPHRIITEREADISADRLAARRAFAAAIDRAKAGVAGLAATVRALSPQATLDRGFAVVTSKNGRIIKSPGDAKAGAPLGIRLAKGTLTATVTAPGKG